MDRKKLAEKYKAKVGVLLDKCMEDEKQAFLDGKTKEERDKLVQKNQLKIDKVLQKYFFELSTCG